jgi:molecular chaperone DnaK
MQAAEICGIKVYRLVNEATAAALTYSLFAKGEHGLAIVFDFGAGALDVSIVEYGCGVHEVIATAGDDRLGGDDFDQAIFDYLLERIEQELGSSVELSPMQQLVLKESATRAKIALSEASTSRIYFPRFVNTPKRLWDLDVTLDRDTAESLWSTLFDRMENVLEQAFHDWDRTSALTDLLLIGGTSLIPRVRDRVKRMTGLDPFMGADAEVLVAQGASMWAGVLGGKNKDLLLLDAVSRSYSVEKMGGVCQKVIQRNTTIPTRKNYHVTTTKDNQTVVAIRVFEGEGELSKENTFAGELRLSGLQHTPEGPPHIEIVFEVDANNLLFLSAEDRASGHKVEKAVQSPHRMNPAQIKALQRKVECELLNLKERDRRR